MFRFKQKLATILGDRELKPHEQAGLDAYDIELEDALSNITSTITTTTAVADTWTFSAGNLSPTVAPTTLTAFGVGSITFEAVTSAELYSAGDAFLTANTGDATVTGGNDTFVYASAGKILIQAGTNIIMLNIPTSDPGVPGAIYSLLGVLHISP